MVRQVANYDPTGLTNADPANWVWNSWVGRWEDGDTHVVYRGDNDDKNIITDMIYDPQGRVYQTIDTWLFKGPWSFDTGESFDTGLSFG